LGGQDLDMELREYIHFVLQGLLIHLDAILQVAFVPRDHGQVGADLRDNDLGDIYLTRVAFLVFLDQKVTMLKVLHGPLLLVYLQVAVPQLVASIDVEERLVKHNLVLDILLHLLKPVDGLIDPSNLEEALCLTSLHFNEVVHSELILLMNFHVWIH